MENIYAAKSAAARRQELLLAMRRAVAVDQPTDSAPPPEAVPLPPEFAIPSCMIPTVNDKRVVANTRY